MDGGILVQWIIAKNHRAIHKRLFTTSGTNSSYSAKVYRLIERNINI